MGLALGNLLGAYTSLTTPRNSQQSLRSFISKIREYGVQIKSRYEVNFSGLTDINFFVQDITTPGKKLKYVTIPFDGRDVEIPSQYEFDHDFSLTVLNDASGYMYNAVNTYFATEASSLLANEGYTVTIKAIGDNVHPGAVITLKNVRFKSISGLSFGQGQNDVSTFQVNCSAVNWETTKGSNAETMGALGAIMTIIK